MTNVQLLLSISIPSVLVVLAWLSNTTKLTTMETRLNRLEDRMDRRFDQVDKRFDDLTGKIIGLHERVAVVEAKQP